MLQRTHPINANIGLSRPIPKWSILTKVLSELVLRYIKGNQLSTKFVTLICLQWSYILLHHN